MPPKVISRWAWVVAAALAIVMAVSAFSLAYVGEKPPPARPVHFPIPPPPKSGFNDYVVAVSPDGAKIVLGGANGGKPVLWLQSFDTAEFQPLPGTENAHRPFWSPDSRSIGFFADRRLKRLDLPGWSRGRCA